MLRISTADAVRRRRRRRPAPGSTVIAAAIGLGVLLYGVIQAVLLLAAVPAGEWAQVAIGIGATLLRVVIALLLALAWTIPVGVAIGTNPRLAPLLQPVVQITASVPATALFPVFLLLLIDLPGGLNLAAVLLMLMGTQWYLLFNIIAGASAIPQDLKIHRPAAPSEPLGALAHADLAGPVPLPGHRRDHRQRRRLECQHRGRVRHLWRADLDTRSASAR